MDTYTSPTPEQGGSFPLFRKAFIVACIVIFLLFIVFLIYQNGKSIYGNGI